MRGDGDGWVVCGDGQRRWGRHGAAGLLVRAPATGPSSDAGSDPGDPLVLLQLRVGWSHHGGTWGIPGGARDSGETAVQAALREAAEETGIDPDAVAVRGQWVDDLGGDPTDWTYTTVVGDVAEPLATVADHESDALGWVPQSQITALELHPGLRAGWPRVLARPVSLVLDVANIVGSVPDGWWRDRAGATKRLLTAVARTVPRTVAPAGVREWFAWVAETVAVVEGAARAVPEVAGVELVRADGSGDDAVVSVVDRLAAAEAGAERAGEGGAGSGAGGPTRALVVTADRGLIARLPPGTGVLGPATVRGWLTESH